MTTNTAILRVVAVKPEDAAIFCFRLLLAVRLTVYCSADGE
jgi:hypothetical protein